jgi:hypothetical protein
MFFLPATRKVREAHSQCLAELNKASGHINELTSRINVLTGQLNELTGLNNSLTGERNRLVGKVNQLTGERNELTGRVAAFAGQRRAVRSTNRDWDAASAADMSLGRLVHRASKFLIVSNMRTGSTWLQTLLGALPDVATDFEMKWDVDYAPSPGHFFLNERSPTVSQVLERLTDSARPRGPSLPAKQILLRLCAG